MSSVKMIIRARAGQCGTNYLFKCEGNTTTSGVLSEGKVFLENLKFEKGLDELVGFRFSERQKRHPN